MEHCLPPLALTVSSLQRVVKWGWAQAGLLPLSAAGSQIACGETRPRSRSVVAVVGPSRPESRP